MSTQLRLIAAAVTALAMSQVSAQSYGNPDYSRSSTYGYGHSRAIRCESVHSRRTYCRANTQGTVQLMRQLSRNACIRGRTWSADYRGIWVSNGCRADFAVSSRRGDYNNDGNSYNGPDRNYYNGSGNDNRNDYRNGDSRDGNGGYVDRYGNRVYNSSGSNDSGRLIRCDSSSDGRTYCHNESNGPVRLSRTYGGDCTEGQTWGSDRRGIWVSGDCQASFNVDGDSGYDGQQYQH